MIWLGCLLKESLIFVPFGFSFLNWSNTPKSGQICFLVKSEDCLSPVRKKAVNLNIPYVNNNLNTLFSVWYSHSIPNFPKPTNSVLPKSWERNAISQLNGWVRGSAGYVVALGLPAIKFMFTTKFQRYPMRSFPEAFGNTLVKTALLLVLVHCWF